MKQHLRKKYPDITNARLFLCHTVSAMGAAIGIEYLSEYFGEIGRNSIVTFETHGWVKECSVK
jgi:hypothetical protein